MYGGFFLGWAGLWFIFGQANMRAIVGACAAVVAVHFFVCFYEEPTLRAKFGESYTEFCEHVGRWIPRIDPWSPPA
jgi:protein-S-isoprenylcysteine O-methyltransferase Ste14